MVWYNMLGKSHSSNSVQVDLGFVTLHLSCRYVSQLRLDTNHKP